MAFTKRRPPPPPHQQYLAAASLPRVFALPAPPNRPVGAQFCPLRPFFLLAGGEARFEALRRFGGFPELPLRAIGLGWTRGARRAGCHRPSGGKPPVLSPESGRGRSGAWPTRAGARQALASPGRPSARRRKPHRTRARPRAREGMAAPQRRRARSCGRRQPAR